MQKLYPLWRRPDHLADRRRFSFCRPGWQKYNEFTIAGTQGAFTQTGVPGADLLAPVVATLELAGGIALILDLATRPIALLLALNMIVAMALVHAPAGIFVEAGGFELVLILGASALAVALSGPGKLSLDNALFGRTSSRLRLLA